MLLKQTIEGAVVTEPELRFSTGGMAICKFRMLAKDRKKNDETNEWEDSRKLWIDVTCFKDVANNVAESVIKGENLVVVGKFMTDEWDDKDTGEKRQKTVFNADTVAISLQFRTVRHGEGKAARSTGTSGPADDPWAAPAQSDEPPF